MPNGIGAKGQQVKTPANPLPPKLSMQTRKRERSQAHRPTSLPSLAKHLFAALIVRRLARRSRTSSHAARCAQSRAPRSWACECRAPCARGTRFSPRSRNDARCSACGTSRKCGTRSTTPRTRPWFPVLLSPRHSGARRRQRPKWRRRPRTNQFHCNKRCPFGVTQSTRMAEIATYFGE